MADTGFTKGFSQSTCIKKAFDPINDSIRVNAVLNGDVDIGKITIMDPVTGEEANVIINGSGQKRLLVDAGVTSVEPNDVVIASTHNTVDSIKANYTVPAGKTLFITSVWASTRSADIIAQLQHNGVALVDIPVSSGANSFGGLVLPTETPYGSFAAGAIIQIQRIEGLSGLAWSAGWVGYLV